MRTVPRRYVSVSLALTALLLLSACGVDTTGLSAATSRQPRGNASSPVVLLEFSDLQCPACKAVHELVTNPLFETYGSRVRFEVRQFPLKTIHANALEAAEASECAADQGKFWEFIDIAYARQDTLSSQALRDWGKVLGLDGPLFDRCILSGIKEGVIDADLAEGARLKVEGTPTFFVNGEKMVDNSLEALSAALDKAFAVPL